MKPVIGPENDDSVFCNGALIERIEKTPDLSVSK